MPNFSLLISEFYNQFNNGENLDTNLADNTFNLAGNVTDRMKTRQRIAINWFSQSDTFNTFDITGSGNTVFRNAGDFIIDKFVVGDIISMRDDLGAADVFVDREILNITSTIITFDGASVGLASFGNARIIGKTPLESLRFAFGLIGNTETTNFVSKIDGTAENRWSADSIITTGGQITMTPQTGVNSWKEDNGIVTVEFISQLGLVENFAQVFEIQHNFTGLPYFLDGQFSNIQTKVAPPLFTSSNTLKYVWSGEFNNALSNPNGTKQAIIDTTLGAFGWFEESLNGGVNSFSVGTPTYINQDTLLVVDEIQAQQKTRVNFTLSDSLSSFIASTNVVVGISILQTEANYQQNANTIDKNFLLDTKFTTVDLGNVSSGIIKDFTATKISSSLINIQFDVDYLTIDENSLQDQSYVIWCATADPTKTAINTNRAVMIVDAEKYNFNTDTENLIFIDQILHFPHDVDDTDDANAFDNIRAPIEDGFVTKALIQVNNDLDTRIDSIKVHMSAFNPSTDDKFDLQTYTFNLSSKVVVPSLFFNDFESIEIDSTRNFKLVDGSQFNKAIITTIDGFALRGPINVKQYILTLGIKVNFEDWIALPGANGVFFKPGKPNDNLNLRTSNYSLRNGYEIVVTIEPIVRRVGQVPTTYEFLSQPHAYFDYDLDNQIIPTYSISTIILDEAGINTSLILKTGEKNKVIATYTPVSGNTALVNPIGIIRISPDQGSIDTIRELSSIRDSQIGNFLIPLVGENFTKVTDNGTTIVLECLIDGDLIDDSINYDVSSRLMDTSTEIGLLTEDGELISTEVGDIIIIE